MAKKKKQKEIFFVVSKSGNKVPRIHFYDGSRSVSREHVSVSYKNADTGRFVTRLYGRDTRSGQIIVAKKSSASPRSYVTEKVPRPGYGDRVPQSSPIYFKKGKK